MNYNLNSTMLPDNNVKKSILTKFKYVGMTTIFKCFTDYL